MHATTARRATSYRANGASQLIDMTRNPRKPFDHILFPDNSGPLIILQINPALVVQDEALTGQRQGRVEIIRSIRRTKAKGSPGETLRREASRIAQHLRVALERARNGIYAKSTTGKVGFE